MSNNISKYQIGKILVVEFELNSFQIRLKNFTEKKKKKKKKKTTTSEWMAITGSYGNQEVLHILQDFRTEALPSDAI